MVRGFGFFQAGRRWLRGLASPAVVFFVLPWLMVLLVLGTAAQKELGLYAAQHLYFSSWILWAGPIPLPGGYAALGLLSVCLFVKFVFFSPWRWRQAGIVLTHFGVLVLLIGGLMTAITQKEGFLILGEGQSAAQIQDYHRRILYIEKDGQPYEAVEFESLLAGKAIKSSGLPFEVIVESVCKNCRPGRAAQGEKLHGIARQMSLAPKEPEKENEANLSGVMLKIRGLSDEQDGIYLTMEEIPHRPSVKKDGARYDFYMGRAQETLPFAVELKDFRREMHPGTDTARSFSSDVIVHDGEASWPYPIRMNEPLRYKGYTFYQSSFTVRPDGEYSILSVVQNKGRAFPYIASGILFAGLVLHIIIRLRRPKGRV